MNFTRAPSVMILLGRFQCFGLIIGCLWEGVAYEGWLHMEGRCDCSHTDLMVISNQFSYSLQST